MSKQYTAEEIAELYDLLSEEYAHEVIYGSKPNMSAEGGETHPPFELGCVYCKTVLSASLLDQNPVCKCGKLSIKYHGYGKVKISENE